MKSSTRILILLIVFELLIVGAGHLSITQIRSGAWNAGTEPEEVIKAIRDAVKLLIPVIGGILIALFLVLRAGEKRAEKNRNA